MANEVLLRQVMEKIKSDLESWNQESWFAMYDQDGYPWYPGDFGEPCETAYCFAGWTGIMTGFEKPAKETKTWDWRNDGEHISDYAQRALGLSTAQADTLFAGENTLDDLENLVEAIIENPEIGFDDLIKVTERGEDKFYCTCCNR